MRITGSQVGSVTPLQAEKVKKTTPAAAPGATQPTDTVHLSSDVEVIAAARDAIAQTPDIREEKVAALRKAIGDGTYQAPAEQVAEKILTEGRQARLSQK
ncbi:MAG TPA: flagellar biosynthesis anti-sigma factor FlgM [Armatimonadota bacterium]|nr:flagellar biosynthesis anti-sigma factor FlgM [Armatimonadota bacterium]